MCVARDTKRKPKNLGGPYKYRQMWDDLQNSTQAQRAVGFHSRLHSSRGTPLEPLTKNWNFGSEKTWEAMVGRHLQGNQTIPGLLRWCRILSIHSRTLTKQSKKKDACGLKGTMTCWCSGRNLGIPCKRNIGDDQNAG